MVKSHSDEMIYTQFTELGAEEIPLYAKQAGEMKMWLIPGLMTFDKLSNSWAKPSVIDSEMQLPVTKELHPYIQKVYKPELCIRKSITSQNHCEHYHYVVFFTLTITMLC